MACSDLLSPSRDYRAMTDRECSSYETWFSVQHFARPEGILHC